MFNFYHLATNAACPERPIWQLTEVGYLWAKEIMGKKPTKKQLQQEKRKLLQQIKAQKATFRFELNKSPINLKVKPIKEMTQLAHCRLCHEIPKQSIA